MDLPRLTPDSYSAADVIALLDLQPLEREGGYFRRFAEGPAGAESARPAYSSILFLITAEEFSALHRLAVDEVWCFLAGDPAEGVRLDPDGLGRWVRLGSCPAEGEQVTDVVRAGTWQGTKMVPGGRWALLAVTAVPAFDWQDFEPAGRDELAQLYPAFADTIGEFTR